MTEPAADRTRAAEPPAPATPEDSLAYWVPIPKSSRLPDVLAWAGTAAADMATERAIEDPETVERLSIMLARLAQEPLPAALTWRLLFMGDPAQGGVVYDVAFVAVDGGEPIDHVETTRADDEAAIGGHTRAFPVAGGQGISSLQVVRAGDDPSRAPGGDEVPIVGRVVCVARRACPGLGEVDVVASTQTVFLEALLVSLPSLEALLGGEALLEMVQATARSPEP